MINLSTEKEIKNKENEKGMIHCAIKLKVTYIQFFKIDFS